MNCLDSCAYPILCAVKARLRIYPARVLHGTRGSDQYYNAGFEFCGADLSCHGVSTQERAVENDVGPGD
jgi:hypothetical protein